jgi:hypothetical protein
MRPAHLMQIVLLPAVVAVSSLGGGDLIAWYTLPEPVPLACVESNPIPESHEVVVSTWPIPPEATPVPRRTYRKRTQIFPPAGPSVVQCAPDSLSSVPGAGDDAQYVPEPSSASITVLGLLALAAVGRLKGKK